MGQRVAGDLRSVKHSSVLMEPYRGDFAKAAESPFTGTCLVFQSDFVTLMIGGLFAGSGRFGAMLVASPPGGPSQLSINVFRECPRLS